jgi:hypothetical protein
MTTHKVKLLTSVAGMSLREEPFPNMDPFKKIPDGTEVMYLETGSELRLGGSADQKFIIKVYKNTGMHMHLNMVVFFDKGLQNKKKKIMMMPLCTLIRLWQMLKKH